MTLTDDQVAAMDQVRDDLARPTPMLRLLQGDVGSGKTAVAAYALAAAARAGFQGALLAPTDLLARQHLDTVGALLADLGVDVILLAGSLKAAERHPGPGGHRLRARPRSWSGRTPCSRTRSRSPGSGSRSSTSSIASASSSAASSRPRPAASRRTSC